RGCAAGRAATRARATRRDRPAAASPPRRTAPPSGSSGRPSRDQLWRASFKPLEQRACQGSLVPGSAARAGAGLLVRLDSLAVDLAAPRPGRGAALLDEVLEPLQVALNAHVLGAEHVADALGHVLRLPVEVELDLRLARVERCEEHDALGPRARGAPPRDHAIGRLLDDLRVPFLDLPGDRGAPVQAPVVELLHGLDAFHEARELLELGPLVVGDAHRHGHLDRLLELRHLYASLSRFFHELLLRDLLEGRHLVAEVVELLPGENLLDLREELLFLLFDVVLQV